MIGEPPQPGGLQAGLSGLADASSAPLVLVVGSDIADPGMESYPIPVRLQMVEFGPQHGRVPDRFQVRMLGLQVAEEALDPGLISGLSG
jgi:hypothetical protein